ncbi:MAG: type IX secretion system membrane protein PorP/SprF, partial [Syntrophothermus sp.]
LPRKYTLHTDFVITSREGYNDPSGRGVNSAWKFNPGITYLSQNKMSAIEAGMNILKYNCYAGAWLKSSLMYQSTTALALLAGYRYYFADDMSIRFMYSYDVQISGLAKSAGGAHEISIVLEFENLSFSGKNSGYNYRRKNSQPEFNSF